MPFFNFNQGFVLYWLYYRYIYITSLHRLDKVLYTFYKPRQYLLYHDRLFNIIRLYIFVILDINLISVKLREEERERESIPGVLGFSQLNTKFEKKLTKGLYKLTLIHKIYFPNGNSFFLFFLLFSCTLFLFRFWMYNTKFWNWLK